MRRPAALLVASLAIAALLAGPAWAAGGSAGSTVADPNALRTPPALDRPPAGHRRTAQQVIATAARVAKVHAAVADHPGAYPVAYLKGADEWQVSWYTRSRSRQEIAQVTLWDPTGRVLEAWTGFQVAWTMARGYPGAFGRKSNALYVWIPLCVLFFVPFFDRRRPLRLLHLDLLVLLGFSISLAFFNHAEIGLSVPLVYPFLGYLLVRMLALGFRRQPLRAGARATGRRGQAPLRLAVPRTWLAVATVFLLAFRIGLNVTNSNVIDVGYAGVIGADHLVAGKQIYGAFPSDNQHGDTYGAFNYEAYVPFERALRWSGRWDDLPAAHAAAIAFDLLTALGLWLLGRRLRGPTLGVALAYAWAAYPFALFASSTNSNDALVSMLVVGALLVVSSAPARGAAVALAGLTKFAPLALAPLLWRAPEAPADLGRRPRRLRGRGEKAVYALAFAVTAALVMLPVLVGGHEHAFYARTLGFQESRGSPFSVWGLYGGLGTAQAVVKVAGLVFAAALAFVPRRRDVFQIAALGAAVIISLQLGVTHWFYLYVVWFFPLVLVALLGRAPEPAPQCPPTISARRARARAAARSQPRVAAPAS